ncbi:MAG: hypothetical protein IJ689_00640 [Alphaproteobacteria bacterium]|nr:hypothetical protein [Alphaproteobacteria bacterium]
MINKTFLILLLTGISYTAFNAVAVSENFEISTTIDHEITLGNFRTSADDGNLTKTGDINLGTIVINPGVLGNGQTYWGYDDFGVISFENQGAISSATSPIIVGTFSANIPNPSDCNTPAKSCGGLSLSGPHSPAELVNFFGWSGNKTWCRFYMKYSGNGNTFKVYPHHCFIDEVCTQVNAGVYTGTLTISYTPS